MSVNGGAFNSVSSSYVISGTSPVTLTPGYYPNGLIASGIGVTVTMQPGIYYMGGAVTVSGSVGFQVSGPTSTQTGTGVMFYGASGGFNFSGTGATNIPAPSTGTYQGISIFENRTSTAAVTLSGSENQSFGGTIYAADGAVTLSGTSTATFGSTVMGAQYIVGSLTISGSGNITVNGGAGAPLREIQLIQ
jgi:hypothetical protein